MVKVFFKKIFCVSIIIVSLFPLFIFDVRGDISKVTHFNSSKDINLSFEDLNIDLSILPEIEYTSLNDIWYNPKIEMLIVTPNNNDFMNAVEPLSDWKNEKGVKTIILSNFSAYEGVDNAEKIRNMITSYYEKDRIKWVLLAGDAQEDLIPIREVFNPDTQRWTNGNPELGNEELKPTDFYYADLTGTWDNDNDGNWGEAPQDNAFGLDEISWIPEVYVGRFPANNADELEIMINKTLSYEVNPNIGQWMNSMLLAGGISNYAEPPDDPDGEDEARLTEYLWKNYIIEEMNFTHLYRTTAGFTPEGPPFPNNEGSLTSYKTQFNSGYSTVLFAGHGAYNQLADSVGAVYWSNDAKTASNTNMPSLIYIDACTTAPYDINSRDANIGEILIKRDQAGAIGIIGGLRVTWYFSEDENLEMINRGNAKLFWEEFFLKKKFQQGKALYDSKVSYINSDYFTKGTGSLDNDFERKNVLTYCLLGDPELDIYTNTPKVAKNPFNEEIYAGQLISTIIKDINENPVPYARVHLRTSDGKYHTVYADINGVVQFRVPNQKNETYNITVTGHNLIPSNFNFTTYLDNEVPELHGVTLNPKNLKTSDNIYLTIEAEDKNSGIESVALLLSTNSGQNYSTYKIANNFEENENIFTFNLGKLKPGEFSYSLVIRDYANNSKIFNMDSFEFTINKPLINYIFTISLILIVGIVGVSIIIVYKGMQRYTEIIRKIEDKI